MDEKLKGGKSTRMSSSKTTVSSGQSTRFVGGSRALRRQVQRKAAVPILNPIQRQKAATLIPPHSPPMERMFGAFLRSLPHEILSAHESSNDRFALMKTACSRLGLSIPGAIRDRYPDLKTHCNARASLLLEETRHVLSSGLYDDWGGHRPGPGPDQCIPVLVDGLESPKFSTHAVVLVQPQRLLKVDERMETKPGTFVQLIPTDGGGLGDVILGNIVGFSRKKLENEGDNAPDSIPIMVYQGRPATGTAFRLRTVASLLNTARQFAACMEMVPVEFWPSLIGLKEAVHTRFVDDPDSGTDDQNGCPNQYTPSDNETSKSTCTRKKHRIDSDADSATERNGQFILPCLNESQHRAAESFLRSKEGTLSLVQG